MESILYDIPMAQGWAFLASAIEGDPFGSVERAGRGYIGQEIVKKGTGW